MYKYVQYNISMTFYDQQPGLIWDISTLSERFGHNMSPPAW